MVFYLICKTLIIHRPFCWNTYELLGVPGSSVFRDFPADAAAFLVNRTAVLRLTPEGLDVCESIPPLFLLGVPFLSVKTFTTPTTFVKLNAPMQQQFPNRIIHNFYFRIKPVLYRYAKLFPPLWPLTHNGHR